jgi:hypothetical protein
MRFAGTMALLAVLGMGSAAKAADEVVEQIAAPAPEKPSLPAFGIMADAGIPDGIQGSLVFRPAFWLRTSIGGGYNMISYGVRGGVSILPFGRGPSLTVEGGHFFDGNANATARRFVGAGFQDNAALERIGYDFANAHLGLDFGYKRVTFFIHGGMSYVRGRVYNLNSFVSTNPSIDNVDSNGLEVSVKGPATVKAIGPSAKLGLIVYLW